MTRSHSRSRACEIPPSGSSGKHVVGDPHLVGVGVAREGQQRGDLRLPSEPADAALAGGHVGDDGRAAADAVAIAIERIFEREQRLVGNRFDQSRAEQRDRHPPRDDVDLRRHHRLAPVIRDREHLEQRREADDVKLAVGVAVPGAHLRHRRDAADHRHVVTGRAARAVEQRAEAFARLFDLHEVVEPEAEGLELAGRDARQRIAGADRQLRGHAKRGEDPAALADEPGAEA